MLSTYTTLARKTLSIITSPNCYCIFINQKVTHSFCLRNMLFLSIEKLAVSLVIYYLI